jgi:hypothetical protein
MRTRNDILNILAGLTLQLSYPIVQAALLWKGYQAFIQPVFDIPKIGYYNFLGACVLYLAFNLKWPSYKPNLCENYFESMLNRWVIAVVVLSVCVAIALLMYR